MSIQMTFHTKLNNTSSLDKHSDYKSFTCFEVYNHGYGLVQNILNNFRLLTQPQRCGQSQKHFKTIELTKVLQINHKTKMLCKVAFENLVIDQWFAICFGLLTNWLCWTISSPPIKHCHLPPQFKTIWIEERTWRFHLWYNYIELFQFM